MAAKLFLLVVTTATLVFGISSSEVSDPQSDTCTKLSSCSTCLSKSYCSWCVTKSKCTKQACGNDNVIYPKHIKALMAGPQFCPSIVKPKKQLIFESGKNQMIEVKITQVYLYMAFTPWKCEISVDGEKRVVTAILIADQVFCHTSSLINNSNKPYVSGSAAVMWDDTKSLDGQVEFKVCRCDLEPNCEACKD